MDRLHFEDSPRQSFTPASEAYESFTEDERSGRDRWNPDDDAEYRFGPRGKRFSRDSQFSERPVSSYQRFERGDSDRYVAQDRFENRPIRYDSRGSQSYTDYDESLDFSPRTREDFRTPSDFAAERQSRKSDDGYRGRGHHPGEDFDRFSQQSGYRAPQFESQRSMNQEFNTFPGIGSSFSSGSTQRREPMRSSKAGRGPKGYKRSDQRLEEEVNDLLTDHPGIDASEIEVKVAQGEVTLSGSVDNRQEKRLVEDLAAAVVGVVEVINNVRVTKGGRQ